MTHSDVKNPTRRGVLAGGGSLVVSFALLSQVLAQEGEVQGASPPAEPRPKLPGSLAGDPFLDAWIRIDGNGKVSVFTGKAELGQGVKTAIIQVAAEELEIDPATIRLITADTGQTPNEGYTAGSQSMQNSGTAIRHAAAQVRDILIGQAAARWQVPIDQLRAENGRVIRADGQALDYGSLVSAEILHVEATPQSRLKPADRFRHMGKSMHRVDIPAKVTGAPIYVQDMRLPGMVHARVVRPPRPGATLVSLDSAEVERMSGVVAVVRNGSFLAVVAEREFQAIKAMQVLEMTARWSEGTKFPKPDGFIQSFKNLPSQQGVVAERSQDGVAAARTFQATFTRPYQIHGSIGPSCAVALLENGTTTVWSHTQGVYPDRAAISEMLRVPPEQVRVIHVEGSGCYGHNGADDAAADAALIAQAMPGRPVRLQWMREQEHVWEPYGPAMLTEVRASLDQAGRIVEWNYDLWSNTHTTRPGPAGSLIAAHSLPTPFQPPPAKLSITPSGNGDRNAVPLYAIPNMRVIWHFLPEMPLRVSALRALGAYVNVFAIESTMDELALMANADPVEFRLRHMEDPRGRAVIEAAAADFGWSNDPLPEGRGRGFAFARYKNLAAYLAMALELEVERETGRARIIRVASAIDSGEVVNPDGIRNQTEGGIIQAASWTLYEAVTFEENGITSIDWSSYPIMRFGSVPERIDVRIMDRPGEPFLGTGEAAQGPTPAAIANAIRHATGKRLYDIPFRAENVKAAIGV
ncbi:xanthine dehydrogenase family protein molybdopterin-binding subunit [Microvirga arabica]|uniref:Molybdopterin cofactor-binding domain-containing protein n=1 Tax=Microvirga arabica TaxID=1128671 RepID=A0ABV6Y9L6_9HYPH|nr:molybdopterin cofactor-binding domain-containing protein [Microvirga arabica]MBM1174523.1 xanthine dehydrogenase family protein molybdopterin-binding subunit [Microvirga arabica]